jgi:lipoprotein NlpD
MTDCRASRSALPIAVGVCLVLAGCASKSPAPIVDRSPGGWMSWPANSTATATPPSVSANPVVPVQAPAGAGYHRVAKGDTLYSIALDNGQDYKEVAEWNKLSDPAQIQIGQLLRVVPPGAVVADNGVAVSQPIGSGPQVESAPLDGKMPPKGSARPTATAAASTARWGWPSSGQLVASFSGERNKGIDLAGKPGDPVMAAGDGKVVYSGNGLRGYGNLVIVKHDAEYLTAYAHNRKILVREGQQVKRGEKIAEMGDSDADRVKLHFELRRQGKPVDPLKHLPAR